MDVVPSNNAVMGSPARRHCARGFALALLLLYASVASADLPALEVSDVNGARHKPFEAKQQKATLLIFTTHDCPIANAYAPEIKRICETYEAKGVRIFLVHVDPDLSAENARKHAIEFGFACPVLLDRAHALVKAAGATMTPEAALFSPDGTPQYLGRIDDHYAAYMKKRAAPTRRDLREALDELLSGKPVSVKRAEPIGCYIPELEGAKK